MKRELTCIVCPMGCSITVTLDSGKVTDITGNTCPRGAEYARNECTNPTRTVTSTVMCDDGLPVSVKTDRPIPKDKIFECIKTINSVRMPLPVKIGDVAARNVFGSNIVVTSNRKNEFAGKSPEIRTVFNKSVKNG